MGFLYFIAAAVFAGLISYAAGRNVAKERLAYRTHLCYKYFVQRRH